MGSNFPYASRMLVSLLGIALVLTIACGGDSPATPEAGNGDPPAPGRATPRQQTQPAPGTPAQPPPARPDQPVLEIFEAPGVPRSISAGDLTYTVTRALLTNQVLRTYGRPVEPVIGEEFHLVAHVAITNELSTRRQVLQLDQFALGVDGARLQPVQVPGQVLPAVNAAAAVDYILAFPVEHGARFESMTLVFGRPGKEPALLPVTGQVPESPYPYPGDITEEALQVTSANPCGTTVLIEPLSVEIDLDARLDIPGLPGEVEGGRRAAVDERFVRIHARATGDSGQCGGANVTSAIFRLEVDGVPRAPASHIDLLVRQGQAEDFTLVFAVPHDAVSLVLSAGQPGGSVARFDVEAYFDS